MHEFQEWTFTARDRLVIARVEIDGSGGGVINRYQVFPGPSQSGLSIAVKSQAEAAERLEQLVTSLLGPNW